MLFLGVLCLYDCSLLFTAALNHCNLLRESPLSRGIAAKGGLAARSGPTYSLAGTSTPPKRQRIPHR